MKLSAIDLAVVDVYRDRERGIPRYNEFRQWWVQERFHDCKPTKKDYQRMLEPSHCQIVE